MGLGPEKNTDRKKQEKVNGLFEEMLLSKLLLLELASAQNNKKTESNGASNGKTGEFLTERFDLCGTADY